jgi:hypothetical protein
MDVCVAWSDGRLTNQDSKNLSGFIAVPQGFYVGVFTEQASSALDSFCLATDSTLPQLDIPDIEIIEVSVEHGPWTSNTVHFIGEHDVQSIILDDHDEGAVLEKVTWASLESVFRHNLHKSPQVHYGETHRELTDVIASYQYGTFLFEAKDLSIFAAGTTRTRIRRVLGIQKQTKTAIGQLVGASKKAKRGEKITDFGGNNLPLVLDKPFHCIVLLSDLMPEGDWDEVVALLCDAMIETRDFFHVLDLSELINILKGSNGKAELLDYNLMERHKAFVEHRSVHIRCNFIRPPSQT